MSFTISAAAEVEKVVLGICLLEEETATELIVSLLQAHHFGLDSHERVFKAIAQLHTSNQPVGIITVMQELAKSGDLDAVGAGWLTSLTEGLPRRTGEEAVRNYIDRVKEFWRQRELLRLGEDLACYAQEADAVASSIVQGVTERLQGIVEDSAEENAGIADSIVTTLDEFTRRRSLKASPGMPYGVPELDKLTGGMMPGLQTAVGALPGIGKTTFMCQAILETLRAGYGVDAFLYEPTKYQVTMQLISLMINAPYKYITKPWTCPAELNHQVMCAGSQLAEMPLRMYDRAGMTLDDQLGLARLAISRRDSRLICTDFIQRMKIKAEESNEPKRLKVARASQALADLVKGTKAHSLLLSQIGTGRKSGAAGVPTMFDFNESGSIEQDARTILLLYREYDEKQGHFGSKGAIFCSKQTFGAPGNVEIFFDPVTAAWRDQAPETNYPQTWHDREAAHV